MSTKEKEVITTIVEELFAQLPLYALRRCTFFADKGHQVLEKIAGGYNPQIWGDDKNPFDQHYWLSISFPQENNDTRRVIIDPIFGYVGLEGEAEKFLDEDHVGYYLRKRFVSPNIPRSEGGILIKTMGI